METTRRGRRQPPGPVVGLAASALGAGGAALTALLALVCWREIRRQWAAGLLEGSIPVPAALETIAWVGTGLLASWVAGLLLIGALASLPGCSAAPLRLSAARLAPRLAPGTSALLIATVLALLPSTAAHAGAHGNSAGDHSAGDHLAGDHLAGDHLAGGSPEAWASSGGPSTAAPEPGWRPTASAPVPDPSAIALVSRGGAAPDAVVVRSGDTLWDIAARHLGDDADAATIAAAWPQWHESNRATIGDDPDHILPGTRLVPPAEVSP